MATWDYSSLYGTEKWKDHWSVGVRQSPIDIDTKQVVVDGNLTNSIKVDESGVRLNALNKGVNVSITPNPEDKKLILSGGPLQSEFQFHEFHFHWAAANDDGSEHALDGKKYQAELHLVHWNKDLCSTAVEAISSESGLTVLGTFLEVTDSEGSPELDSIIKILSHVQHKNDTFSSAESFNPYSLISENREEYFTYYGSLTTPPCSESVNWIVFKHPRKISNKQLEAFRNLSAVASSEVGGEKFHDPFSRSGEPCCQAPKIRDNYRPVMPLEGRVVRSSFKVEH